jgi:hypothetical protein
LGEGRKARVVSSVSSEGDPMKRLTKSPFVSLYLARGQAEAALKTLEQAAAGKATH